MTSTAARARIVTDRIREAARGPSWAIKMPSMVAMLPEVADLVDELAERLDALTPYLDEGEGEPEGPADA